MLIEGLENALRSGGWSNVNLKIATFARRFISFNPTQPRKGGVSTRAEFEHSERFSSLDSKG